MAVVLDLFFGNRTVAFGNDLARMLA